MHNESNIVLFYSILFYCICLFLFKHTRNIQKLVEETDITKTIEQPHLSKVQQ